MSDKLHPGVSRRTVGHTCNANKSSTSRRKKRRSQSIREAILESASNTIVCDEDKEKMKKQPNFWICDMRIDLRKHCCKAENQRNL